MLLCARFAEEETEGQRQSGGAPALRPGAIAQSPGREAALAWASLAQRSPASSVLAREGGNPLQCSCLESPKDCGAWWAAVYGVAHSRTRLKRLSIWNSLAFSMIQRMLTI